MKKYIKKVDIRSGEDSLLLKIDDELSIDEVLEKMQISHTNFLPQIHQDGTLILNQLSKVTAQISESKKNSCFVVPKQDRYCSGCNKKNEANKYPCLSISNYSKIPTKRYWREWLHLDCISKDLFLNKKYSSEKLRPFIIKEDFGPDLESAIELDPPKGRFEDLIIYGGQ